MTPGEAIHKFCVSCVGGAHEVQNCGGDKCLNGGCDTKGVCWFYRYRMGRGRPSVKLIAKICRWCMGGDMRMVRECPGDSDKPGVHCHLWQFRLGKNPNIIFSDERKEKLRIAGSRTLYAAKTA